jgi:hypothetical protein
MARQSGFRRGGSRVGGARNSGGGARRSSGGGSRGGGSRGGGGGRSGAGRGRAPARGGGSNATAIGVGIVLLVGVIAIIAFVGGKKKNPAPAYVSEELTADSNVNKGDGAAKEAPREPPPKISDALISNAKAILEQAREEEALGDALYEEAMNARRDGNEASWQDKLDKARSHYINIKEMWNDEIIAAVQEELEAMPSDGGYDADQVANYWIGKEAGKITKMLDKLGMITKQQRMK